MIRGSTPASSPPIHVAIGFTPSSFAFSSLITMIAAAASLIPEELAAVTIPSGLNAGRRPLMFSFVTPFLGPSSVSKIKVSFFFLISTGTISSLNLPSAMAFSAFCWLHAANSSSCSLVSPHCSQIFSAVIPIWYPPKASVKASRRSASSILAAPIR